MMGLVKADLADPALMLAFLRDKASARKLRLFACACCRLVWDLLEERTGRARVEAVENRLERQRLRRCMGGLTDLQRESVTLAYYSGYTYQQVSELLGAPLGTVKTRMRDGLARLRDCLGVGRG